MAIVEGIFTMPTDPLPPDPESVEKWRSLPQNKPSRDALPPATGGLRLNRALLVGFGILMLAAVVISLLLGR
ncbi:MAG: hypothetical protein U0521_10525 [Anaerolineae bacterium]